MSVTTSAGVQNNTDALGRIGQVEHLIEKTAHLFHELVDRVAHPSEADRLLLHQLVAEVTGGITRNQARDAVTDPTGYVDARDNGAYDVPEEVKPQDPAAARIAELEAELEAARRVPVSPQPPTPPAAPEVDAAAAARIAELEAEIAARDAAAQTSPVVPSTADSGHTAGDAAGGSAGNPNAQPAAGDGSGAGNGAA